jgi:hypothetical protein
MRRRRLAGFNNERWSKFNTELLGSAGRTTTEENSGLIVIPAEAGIYPDYGHRPEPVLGAR